MCTATDAIGNISTMPTLRTLRTSQQKDKATLLLGSAQSLVAFLKKDRQGSLLDSVFVFSFSEKNIVDCVLATLKIN